MATAAHGRDRIWSGATARHLAVGLPLGAAIGLTMGIAEDGVGWGAVVDALFLAVAIGVVPVVTARRRIQRDPTGVNPPPGEAAEVALGRALRTGELPDDPALHPALAQLVSQRRRGNGRHPAVFPISLAIVAALVGAVAPLTGHPHVAIAAALLAIGAAVSYAALQAAFPRYDRLDAALGRGPTASIGR